jgi:hypothetical protein
MYGVHGSLKNILHVRNNLGFPTSVTEINVLMKVFNTLVPFINSKLVVGWNLTFLYSTPCALFYRSARSVSHQCADFPLPTASMAYTLLGLRH